MPHSCPTYRVRDRFTSTLLLALAALALGSCSREHASPIAPVAVPAPATRPDVLGDLARAIAIQEDFSSAILAMPGVAGIATGWDRGRAVLVVLVESSEVAPSLPWSLGGVRVVAEVTGPVQGFALTQRHRPVPIGVSGGNANECLPGTLGCVLDIGGRKHFLSANHVFARQNQAAIGEAIVQPSRPDFDPACGPSPVANVVAELSDFEPVFYDGHTPNLMDAAVARATNGRVSCATLPQFYGAPSATPAGALAGMRIQKVGRSTELTRGAVKAVNAKVKVTFPAGTALFVNQILTTQRFGGFGDSGALVVTDDGTARPVGMVIGGGSNGAAIVTPIGPILARFGATVCER